MRRLTTFLALTAAVVLSGCGGKFELPTEHPAAKIIPAGGAYTLEATWAIGGDSLRDLTMTSGNEGAAVFTVQNHAASTGPMVPRGTVRCFKVATGMYDLTGTALFTEPLHLFNPIALSESQHRLYVLDQGDSCMAKFDVSRGTCEADPRPITPDTTQRPHPDIIRDYSSTWRVRIYPIAGGDTVMDVTSITDTAFVKVSGISVDDQGAVYVSGFAAVVDTNPANPIQRQRNLESRVYRYLPGPRYAGVTPPDPHMPGCNWHRDSTWWVFNGTGGASVNDPRVIAFVRTGGPSLFIADRLNGQAKTVSVYDVGSFFRNLDGHETGAQFLLPEGVAVDPSGFLYVVDSGNGRVLRYDQFGTYIQTVNIDKNSTGQPLLYPVAVGVNDTLAYIADRGRFQILRFKRTP